MAKVSIIVPTYNVENYLVEAMESLVRQTLFDIEIICINDGSTDSSLSILKKYAAKDERITIVDKENGGYGVGMNIGLDKAAGEYIGILEPDDYVPLNMFEDLYKAAKEYDLDLVKADFYRFSRDDKTGDMSLSYNHLSKDKNDYNRIICPADEPRVTRFIMNTWSGIYKREFIEEHHIRHNTTPGASFQDNGFFWQTFMHAKRAMFIDKPYYMNRRDNPNSSVNNKSKVYAINVEYDYIKDIFMRPENEELWERFKYYFTLKKLDNYIFTLGRIADGFKMEYIERAGRELKRATDLGEVDTGLFTKLETERYNLFMNDPKGYYDRFIAGQKNQAGRSLSSAEKELRDIKNSKSYKIGRKITAVPRKIRDAAKKK